MAVRAPGWPLASGSEDEEYPKQLADRTLSHSLLAGLLVLCCLPLEGVAEIARMLGMNTSTTHRSLPAIELLERDVDSRKYRIAGIG
jgi:hypothetical protein